MALSERSFSSTWRERLVPWSPPQGPGLEMALAESGTQHGLKAAVLGVPQEPAWPGTTPPPGRVSLSRAAESSLQRLSGVGQTDTRLLCPF